MESLNGKAASNLAPFGLMAMGFKMGDNAGARFIESESLLPTVEKIQSVCRPTKVSR
jgi:hypothetical protein